MKYNLDEFYRGIVKTYVNDLDSVDKMRPLQKGDFLGDFPGGETPIKSSPGRFAGY